MPFIYKPPKKTYQREGLAKDKLLIRKEIYNSQRWRTLRLQHLINNPVCWSCEHIKNKSELAQDIHHLKSFVVPDPIERKRLAFDPLNLVSLCKKCHADIHTSKTEVKFKNLYDEIQNKNNKPGSQAES